MITPAQKEPDLAIAGLALIVIFGLLMWHDNPIRSDRPFDPSVMQPQYPHTTNYAYESWLWQDPFSFDSSEYVQKDQYYIEYDNYEEKPSWPKSLRLRKKLDLEGDSESEDSAKSYLCTTQFKEYAKKDNVQKILLSLVNVRPDTVENKETRIRHRYAVIAGLMESGYYPSHPDRLNFCASSNTSSNRQFDVRWEHFSNKSNENIIVAWVDNNAFKIISENINSLLSSNLYQEWHHAWICAISKICTNFQILGKNLYIFDWVGGIDKDIETASKFKQNIKTIQPAPINQKLSEKLSEELKNRRISKPSEIAIIMEQDSNAVRSLVQVFKDVKPFKSEKEKITTFSYFKGLDAYQQIIDKPGQNEDYQAARQWDTRLSVTDLHNPPVGPAQFDYLHRIAREIRQTHDVIDLEKRVAGIKAVGIFGSDFYDKLLILKALRTEMPNLLVFTTDLDAQMLHPQHWRWTRNLVVASPFDLRLNEQHQKLFPAFRDSRQTEIFYRTLRILKSGKDSSGNDTTNENHPFITDVSPLIFEIGRDGPVRLTPPVEGTRTECFDELYPLDLKCNNLPQSTEIPETTIHPTNNDLEQSYFRITLFFGITLALILIVANFRPHSGALFFGLLLSSLVIFAIALRAITDVAGEPLSFTNGTSLWPTIFIQAMVILLAFTFIVKGLFDLETNFASLNRRYFKNKLDLKTLWHDQEPKSIRSLLKVNQSGKSELEQQEIQEDSTNKKTETWPLYSLALFLIGAGSIIYAANDAIPEGYITFIVCMALLMASVIICFWIEYARPFSIKAIIFWAEADCYYQDQQSNLKISFFKIYGLIYSLVLACVSAYVVYFEQIDSKISLTGIYWLAVIVGTGGIIIFFLWIINSSHQDQQSNLKISFFKIYGLIYSLVLACGSAYVVYLEQIDSKISLTGIYWLAVIVGTGGIIIFFLWISNSSHPEKSAQPQNTQKFIILQEDDGSGLWQEYHQHGRLDQILFRVAVMWLFFAIIETILFYLLPPWPSPCRGAACDWNQWTGIFGFIFTMLLTFFVLDAVRLNYYFIRKLRTKHPLLLDDSVAMNTEGLSPNDIKKFYHQRKDNPLETLEKIVTLVAERTLVADRLIYYPLLCIMLMLFARITYFDNQDFPFSKAITLSAGISLLIFSGFMIRYEAKKLKQAAVISAENLVGNIDPDSHHCVRKLKEISDGIFQPMLEQPVMRALLLILASVGLFAGEYLMLAGF